MELVVCACVDYSADCSSESDGAMPPDDSSLGSMVAEWRAQHDVTQTAYGSLLEILRNFILDYLRIQERYLKHPLTITLDVRPAQENTIISVLQVVLKPALCCVACRRICSYSLMSTIFRCLSLRRGCKLRAI